MNIIIRPEMFSKMISIQTIETCRCQTIYELLARSLVRMIRLEIVF
jgi:hypothetical protein